MVARLPVCPVAGSLVWERLIMAPLMALLLAGAAAGGDIAAEATAKPGSASAEPAAGEAAKETKPAAPSEQKGGKPSFAVALKDVTKIPGLITLWQKDGKLYAELTESVLGKEFFVLTSISKGIGDRSLLGGMSLGFGDDWVWQFRKVNDAIQVIRRNVRFFAAKGSPEQKAVDLAYTDSILFSLPIVTTGPSGGQVIDLGAIFLTDLPRIAAELPGFSFARDRSTWSRIKGFPDNVELEVAATYLVLRQDVDGTQLDEVVLDEPGSSPEPAKADEPAAASA